MFLPAASRWTLFLPATPRWIKPVSYTHLDVYKRQREAYPEWYERVIVKGEKYPKKWDLAGKLYGDDPYALYHWWLRQILSIPVSYTHLDVYKRQF